MPDNMSPLVTGTSRHSCFSELQSNVLTSSTAASPLTTPGGRSLGRGLDDSPCISGASADDSGRGVSLDSPAIVVSPAAGCLSKQANAANADVSALKHARALKGCVACQN